MSHEVVTRERPKIDRVAWPWLIRRFIDQHPDPLRAEQTGAIPFDIPDVELGHAGDRCSLNAFLEKYALEGLALEYLVLMVGAADTDKLEKSREAPGLLAITFGLNANIPDDQRLLEAAMPVYDALYTWCRSLTGERHGWDPDRLCKEINE